MNPLEYILCDRNFQLLDNMAATNDDELKKEKRLGVKNGYCGDCAESIPKDEDYCDLCHKKFGANNGYCDDCAEPISTDINRCESCIKKWSDWWKTATSYNCSNPNCIGATMANNLAIGAEVTCGRCDCIYNIIEIPSVICQCSPSTGFKKFLCPQGAGTWVRCNECGKEERFTLGG